MNHDATPSLASALVRTSPAGARRADITGANYLLISSSSSILLPLSDPVFPKCSRCPSAINLSSKEFLQGRQRILAAILTISFITKVRDNRSKTCWTKQPSPSIFGFRACLGLWLRCLVQPSPHQYGSSIPVSVSGSRVAPPSLRYDLLVRWILDIVKKISSLCLVHSQVPSPVYHPPTCAVTEQL
jgi:hypothetical protein